MVDEEPYLMVKKASFLRFEPDFDEKMPPRSKFSVTRMERKHGTVIIDFDIEFGRNLRVIIYLDLLFQQYDIGESVKIEVFR